MSTILIQGGLVYDGLGNPGRLADVFIRDKKIVEIGENLKETPDTVIDGKGKIICPGFVDIHRHHDARMLYDQKFGQLELRQGITTAVCGNCGISITPRPMDQGRAAEYYAFEEPVMGPVGTEGPVTFREYMKLLDNKELPLNVAAMVGTGTVKICVKGFSDTPYTKKELEEARALIEEALLEGAPGISLGIMYLPECYSSTGEFACLLEPVGRARKVITTHIRGEGDSMVASVGEVIEIARRAGCALEISHFKSCGTGNWRKDIYRAIEEIENARKEGMDITCDFYPYDGGSTALTTMLPPAFVKGDLKKALKRLGTRKGVEEFRQASRKLYPDWDNFCITLGWDRILISGTVLAQNAKFKGKLAAEAAEEYGFEDAEALAAYLMHSENGKTAIINLSMCQDDIDTVARLPYSNVISDAIYADTDTPHPRMYGAFPKVIREYVKERQILTLEEAIRKMTGQPADRMGLKDRGRLVPGAAADVLVFDLDKFRDHATYAEPAKYADGLEYCIVNGRIAVERDMLTGSKNGMNLRVRT